MTEATSFSPGDLVRWVGHPGLEFEVIKVVPEHESPLTSGKIIAEYVELWELEHLADRTTVKARFSAKNPSELAHAGKKR